MSRELQILKHRYFCYCNKNLLVDNKFTQATCEWKKRILLVWAPIIFITTNISLLVVYNDLW